MLDLSDIVENVAGRWANLLFDGSTLPFSRMLLAARKNSTLLRFTSLLSERNSARTERRAPF